MPSFEGERKRSTRPAMRVLTAGTARAYIHDLLPPRPLSGRPVTPDTPFILLILLGYNFETTMSSIETFRVSLLRKYKLSARGFVAILIWLWICLNPTGALGAEEITHISVIQADTGRENRSTEQIASGARICQTRRPTCSQYRQNTQARLCGDGVKAIGFGEHHNSRDNCVGWSSSISR